ncbi:MAG: Hpt domain-containing protein [Halioglobus sp.]
MIKKPDIVSLKWVIGLMNAQCDKAESALVEYGSDLTQKQPLLRCMWAVHQITSTLKALGMSKAEMLSIEMERSLNFLYKDKVQGERRKLAMGGIMQGLKVIPAYLEHTETMRLDTGRGLEQYVNDLRRWVGQRPRSKALFFYMDWPENAAINAEGVSAPDEEIIERANMMLAVYLEMAKQALRKKNVAQSMKNVARIARKMQILFSGAETERFWFAMIGLCEGIAGNLITPDDCIAQIFKTGAFTIKRARECGSSIDPTIDYDAYTLQMLYYIASCESRPVHITRVREAFGITDETLSDASQALVHSDALIIALSGALDHLNIVVEFVESTDFVAFAENAGDEIDTTTLESLEAAECRLIAAGQMAHADSLQKVLRKMKPLLSGGDIPPASKLAETMTKVSSCIVSVKLDIEHKLQHGLNSTYAGKDFELRESVATATFKQMSLVENHLHQILRRKALKSAIEKKPTDLITVLNLTTALQRFLNKTEEGDEELRQAVRDADAGNADIDSLYEMACAYEAQLEPVSDREAIDSSLDLLQDISGALGFAGMTRESAVIEKCHVWLSSASDAGSVHENDAFRCFADAFAQIEMHLQRSLIDPLDDTSHMVAYAEERAEKLSEMVGDLPSGSVALEAPATTVETNIAKEPLVQDADMPPEFRDVFLEESEEIVAELGELTQEWLQQPDAEKLLRDIRRHFHTFKGNGRAVGANVLGELGWAAQDMLDRSLDGDLEADEKVQALVSDVVKALPGLVESYATEEGPDLDRIRRLTEACFAIAEGKDVQLDALLATDDGQTVNDTPELAVPDTLDMEPLTANTLTN